MFVFRKTMEAEVEAQRQIGANALTQLAKRYGDALIQVTALQRQMSAWVLNKAENITPAQAAQMFYAQDDRWQAEFFNCMQREIEAWHAAQPASPSPGVPAGEGQWWHVAQHLTDEGFETIEAMYEHAKYRREQRERRS